jgi:glutamate dehydrogenase/leucine dehydrogenase
MVRSFGEVWRLCQMHQEPMRLAAYMMAVERVAEAIQLRGVFL